MKEGGVVGVEGVSARGRPSDATGFMADPTTNNSHSPSLLPYIPTRSSSMSDQLTFQNVRGYEVRAQIGGGGFSK